MGKFVQAVAADLQCMMVRAAFPPRFGSCVPCLELGRVKPRCPGLSYDRVFFTRKPVLLSTKQRVGSTWKRQKK